MAQTPQLSQQVRDTLASRGYDANAAFEANRLPSFAIPRTTAYNLTTLSLIGLSLAGLALTKQSKTRMYTQGFAIALGATFWFDYLHRRELDRTSIFSTKSSANLNQQLEKHPQFKKAFETVSAQLDEKISQLESLKLSR